MDFRGPRQAGVVALRVTSRDLGLDALIAEIEALTDDVDVVDSLHRAELIRHLACRVEVPASVVGYLGAAIDTGHDLVALSALHALSSVSSDAAATALTARLDDHRGYVREHAAWALSARPPVLAAVPALLDMVEQGRFPAMLAQRTLAGWASSAAVADRIVARSTRNEGAVTLIDLLGLVPGRAATTLLERVARAGGRAGWSAVAALGARDGDTDRLIALARRDDEIGGAARLAILDRSLRTRPLIRSTAGNELRIAQVVFHADLAVDDDAAGRGDNGGLATLVRQLGDAFAVRSDVGSVTTLSRGRVEHAIGDVLTAGAARRLAPIAVADPSSVDRRNGWIERITIERGIRRALTAGPLPDVVHLRMADVGTLAAQRVARELGVPVVFTAAPDPHQPLRRASAVGDLSPATFGAADERDHYWFRARLVERLTMDAAAVVTLPRDPRASSVADLMGGEAGDRTRRAPAISEGIDPRPVRAARSRAISPHSINGHPLAQLVHQLDPSRHGLPIIVSVGRLHPIKGMTTLAQAWRDDPLLAASTNLVIVGGDFDDPTDDERDVIADLTSILGAESERARRGAILAGHRPSADVARILAGAHLGLGSLVAPGGIYVAASAKEEFGLAIVEALAAGLPVVAPHIGGPSTYLTDGDTGVLADTTSIPALTAAMHRARALVDRHGRVARADELIDSRLSVDAMADALVDVYRSALVSA